MNPQSSSALTSTATVLGFLVLHAGGFDEGPEFGVFLEGGILADGQVRAIEKVFERVAAEDAMNDDAEVVLFEIDAVIAEAEAMEDFAIAFQFAEALEFRGHDLVGQAAEFTEDVQLQFLRHAGELGGAGGIENDLKRAHQLQIKG